MLEELQSSIASHGTTLTIELFRPLPTAINCLADFSRYLVEKIKCTKDSTHRPRKVGSGSVRGREREQEREGEIDFGFDLDQITMYTTPFRLPNRYLVEIKRLVGLGQWSVAYFLPLLLIKSVDHLIGKAWPLSE